MTQKASFTLTPRLSASWRIARGKASLGSFTLIELLVVIAILAILAIAVVLVLNPTELIKESRDTTRIEDLGTINRALSYLQVDQTNAFFGTSTIVYISIPDTTTTCANLGLPTLPSGYTYGCAPTSTYRKADGTGWIPLDFFLISYGSPLAKLPIDPINTTSTGLYYTYIPGGSWELTALMESTKRRLGGEKDVASTDGGQYPELYETGSGLKRTPVNRDPYLVGYWKFDETSGTFTDSSGNGNTGTQSGGVTYGVDGKMGKAVGFSTSTYISLPYSSSFAMGPGQNKTWMFWAKRNAIVGTAYNTGEEIVSDGAGGSWALRIYFRDEGAYGGLMVMTNGSILYTKTRVTGVLSAINNLGWHHYAFVWNRAGNLEIYMNGNPVTITTAKDLSAGYNEDWSNVGSARLIGRIQGSLDEVRIYNRALSAAEIRAIYNATR